jgi:hypothetical protein
MLPSPQKEPERYRGRPLLIILENYVLACIGALEPAADERLTTVVKSVFGSDSDWKQTARHQLQFSDSIDQTLRELWERNQAIAKEQNVDLHAVQFAKMVVDQNFAELIDRPAAQ